MFNSRTCALSFPRKMGKHKYQTVRLIPDYMGMELRTEKSILTNSAIIWSNFATRCPDRLCNLHPSFADPKFRWGQAGAPGSGWPCLSGAVGWGYLQWWPPAPAILWLLWQFSTYIHTREWNGSTMPVEILYYKLQNQRLAILFPQ